MHRGQSVSSDNWGRKSAGVCALSCRPLLSSGGTCGWSLQVRTYRNEHRGHDIQSDLYVSQSPPLAFEVAQRRHDLGWSLCIRKGTVISLGCNAEQKIENFHQLSLVLHQRRGCLTFVHQSLPGGPVKNINKLSLVWGGIWIPPLQIVASMNWESLNFDASDPDPGSSPTTEEWHNVLHTLTHQTGNRPKTHCCFLDKWGVWGCGGIIWQYRNTFSPLVRRLTSVSLCAI